MPIVRLVTAAPAAAGHHKVITAFENFLLDELEWRGEIGSGFEWTPYFAAGGVPGLPAAAQQAVTDAPRGGATPAPTVIVTDGSRATDLVRNQPGADAIAIVQAVGGASLDGPNTTGFYIDTVQTCLDQLAAIAGNVSILYDPLSNPPESDAHDALAAAGGARVQFWTWAQLTANPRCIDNTTFMLIPNGGFYNNRRDIAHLVEGRGVPAVYPEREYKKEHPTASRGRITVHGHHVPFTFIQAAQLTDKILRGEISVTARTLPQMQLADQDAS